jgi:hypothetical protein
VFSYRRWRRRREQSRDVRSEDVTVAGARRSPAHSSRRDDADRHGRGAFSLADAGSRYLDAAAGSPALQQWMGVMPTADGPAEATPPSITGSTAPTG